MHKSFPGLFGSIVVFPNARRIPGENAAPSSQDPDIIMTGYDLVRDVRNRSLARHLEHTLTLFGDHDLVEIRRSAFNQKEMDAVVRFLEDNYTLEPYRAFTDTYYSHLLDQLTQEQIRLLSSLTRNRRVMVFGPAGSGKTMLARWAAMNEAQQLAEKKGRVLLLSYSPVLAAYFSIENTLDNLEITTFQALCAELLKKLAPEMKVPPESASEESRKRFWLDELPSLLEEHPETACYDAVYIDEAQDFDPLWAPALAGLLRDPEQSKLYCFGDPNQKIFENSLDNDFEGFTLFELRENCRNTREIAEMCQRMNGTLEKTAVHDISYRRPEVYPAIGGRGDPGAEFLSRRINELLRIRHFSCQYCGSFPVGLYRFALFASAACRETAYASAGRVPYPERSRMFDSGIDPDAGKVAERGVYLGWNHPCVQGIGIGSYSPDGSSRYRHAGIQQTRFLCGGIPREIASLSASGQRKSRRRNPRIRRTGNELRVKS